MKPLSLILLLAGLAAAAQSSPTVYVVDDLTRVRPEAAAQTTKGAVLKAARNEYAPIQIVVRAGAAALKNVNAEATDLRGKRGRIAASNITLYREHYVEVKKPSPKSVEGAGWYPDALIPFLKPAPQGARFVAAPFEIEAERNQPLWVDVFVPKDAAPGDYSGTVTVTAQGIKPVRVPVRLTVWNFTLPDTPSMRSNFGGLSDRVAKWYNIDPNSEQFHTLEREYADALASNRICPPVPRFLMPNVLPDGSIDPSATHAALKQWIERYHMTGFPIPLLGKDPAGVDRDRNVKYLRAMYAYLKQNGWDKLAYIYVLDEPNTEQAYNEVRKRAQMIHEAQPGIKVLCTEQPTPQKPEWGTLVGSVDIWVPIWFLYQEQDGAPRLAAGEEMWSYTALTQGAKGKETPFWQLDFPLLNYRIPAWINWRFGMTGLLYWTPVYWYSVDDVWTTALSFRNMYNYEGLLLFPGKDAGVSGFVPSMRLKEIRESFEDYEYFKLAADAGKKDEADKLVRSLARSWFDWDTNASHLLTVRERLAQLIQSSK